MNLWHLGPGQGGDFSEDDFMRNAITLFGKQVATIRPYAAFITSLGLDAPRVQDWRAFPAVPTSAFKTHDLSAASSGSEVVVFETSGTTISKPGRVRLSSTDLYEASLLKNFERHLLPDGARLPALVFGPARAEAPRSSLWFMVDRIVERLTTGGTWIVGEGKPRWEIVDAAMEHAEADGQPLLLLGTSLLYMAYFEHLASTGSTFTLPPGSRAMDTGGAKGQRAEFTRGEIEATFTRHLGIPRTHLVNEYGMAEMGSQFYDDNLAAAHEGRPAEPGKQIPPWVRTRVLHPETMEEQPDGERGILVHYDLANLEIPMAIQTEDVGSRIGDRLTLEGRLLGAEARGCSLAFEQFLDSQRGRRTGVLAR